LVAKAQTGSQALGLMLQKRETVSTELARQLIDHVLLSGKYAVGDRLPPERLLASELGVGRSAVREALKSLSLLGLIDVRQGSGSYIRATESEILPRVLDWGLLLGSKRLQDLYETELYLEPAVARIAAKRGQKADVAKLRSMLEKVDRRPTNARVGDIVNFHITLAAITRNEMLMSLVGNMQALMEAWTTRVVDAAGGKYPGQDEHRDVYEAVARGDPDAAEEAMIKHLTNGSTRLSEILGFDWRLEY
jgi:GntR family transcriptional regulator, transcriptional repressor for pyruvate dehydrogenase complex